jgi:ABC-type multidrug transport system permease subunit
MVNGGDGPVPTAHVLLVDQDDSFLSRLLANAGGGGDQQFLDIEKVTEAEGRARMDAGEASAMLVLPKGFTDAVLHDQPATLELVKNPAQRILPSIVETGVEMLIEVIHYLRRLLGDELPRLVDAPRDSADFYSSEVVSTFAGAINERLRGVSGWLFPPVLELATTSDASDTPAESFNFALFMLPGMIFMSVLFISQGMADDVWDEKLSGTLRRAVSLPHNLAWFLGGKLVAAGTVMAGVALVALAIAVAFFGIAPGRLPLAFVWVVYTGTALYCFFQLLHFAGSTKTGANMVSTVVLFPAMMLGGSFFPFEAMPGWMQAIGRWLPNGQAVVRLKELLGGAPDPAALGVAALAIGLPAAAAFAWSARLLRGRFVEGA